MPTNRQMSALCSKLAWNLSLKRLQARQEVAGQYRQARFRLACHTLAGLQRQAMAEGLADLAVLESALAPDGPRRALAVLPEAPDSADEPEDSGAGA
jgi:hypothetical protein